MLLDHPSRVILQPDGAAGDKDGFGVAAGCTVLEAAGRTARQPILVVPDAHRNVRVKMPGHRIRPAVGTYGVLSNQGLRDAG